jgi:Xaa-Pro dipeptidase
MDTYLKRRAELYTWMARNSVAVVVLEDTEGRRDPAIRYLSGHPGDALLILTITGHCVLCPWDEHLAEMTAQVDIIAPYTEFGRHPVTAVRELAARVGVPPRSRIEIPAITPYPLFSATSRPSSTTTSSAATEGSTPRSSGCVPSKTATRSR